MGKFVVIAATVVVKNKTGRKISLSGICFIKVNKIKAICIFVRPEFFLSGLVADFGSISEHYLKNMALGLLAKKTSKAIRCREITLDNNGAPD